MKIKFVAASALTVFCLFHAQARADVTTSAPWWGDRERGWFWYNERDPAPEEEPQEAEPQPEVATPAEPEKPKKPEKVKLNTAWLRENLPKYRDLAIDEPTIPHIQQYLYLQKLTLDRASTFSDQWQRAIQLDPFLDENTRRPLLTAAAAQKDAETGQYVVAALKRMAKETGLMFFYRSDCGPCIMEAPILQAMEREFGFTVFPVSMDGRPLPRGEFPNYKVDNGQAAAWGVKATPTLFLYYNGQLTPIAESPLGFQELTVRILQAGVLSKVLTEEDFDTTRPAKVDAPQMKPPEVDNSTLDSPDKLISILRKKLDRTSSQ
ncbi:conjugal transfer protein TraF [Desulfovibrio sp.]|uniref:conjugal transfer protein TraF n=1 Tax=Desulfovibrio sp. TaxID=885 RepID=UPI0025C5C1FA|nr:conjugal transfer protein TraF [Desulfovibrio sp.]